MRREPSIHITKSKFIQLLRKHPPENTLDWVSVIFEEARGSSLDHRSLILNNNRQAQKVVERVSQPIAQANLLADIIYSTRVKLKHVGVLKIKQTDNQWGAVKQLVEVVNQFCDSYNLEQRDGYIRFVEVALNLMSKAKRVNYNFAPSWMLQKSSWILATYAAINEINIDEPGKKDTQLILDIYKAKVISMTGLPIVITAKDTPQEYACFIKAKRLADKLNIDYDTFIDAQFDALSFCNGIPNKEDLGNQKGYERVIKYLSHNKINLSTIQEQDETPDTIWDEFKK